MRLARGLHPRFRIGGSVKYEEVDTEEDHIAPRTSSAVGKTSFDIDAPKRMKRATSEQSAQNPPGPDDEDEDDEVVGGPARVFSDPHAPAARGERLSLVGRPVLSCPLLSRLCTRRARG